MKLTIISGLSGSGKSVALHTLEDLGYYCIDNLPVGLLLSLAQYLSTPDPSAPAGQRAAVGIDARNRADDLARFPATLRQLREIPDFDCEIVFLQADDDTLLKRFSETRRRHPLGREGTALLDAIQAERELLAPLASNADLCIDTTHTNVHQLSAMVRERIGMAPEGLSVLLQSFGYKHGVPGDADIVFDARCLPNPHWVPELRPLTGKDPAVARFLESQPTADQMFGDIRDYLETWLPRYEAENRAYLTVAIGCTGGQHRSVYLVERLARHFRARELHVLTRHRELS